MNKIAIVVGHTVKADKGAFSTYLLRSEQPYNLEVANQLKTLAPDLYDVYTHSVQDYYKRQKALAAKLNGRKYDLVVELHFNAAASPLANGTECLHWFASKKGKEYAKTISKAIAGNYGTTIRGIDGATPIVHEQGRGYWFTYLPKAPAVIVEPFFGSHAEALLFQDTRRYANTLHKVLSNL